MLKPSISKDCLLFFLATAAFKTFDNAETRKIEEHMERKRNAAGGFDMTMKLTFSIKDCQDGKRLTLDICEE